MPTTTRLMPAAIPQRKKHERLVRRFPATFTPARRRIEAWEFCQPSPRDVLDAHPGVVMAPTPAVPISREPAETVVVVEFVVVVLLPMM